MDGAEFLEITFDEESATEKDCDLVCFYRDVAKQQRVGEVYSGRNGSQNFPGTDGRAPLIVSGSTVLYTFTSDASNVDWGFKFTVKGSGKKMTLPPAMLPLPAFGALSQLKMLGMKAVLNVSHASPSLHSMLSRQMINQVLSAAVQPSPQRLVWTEESFYTDKLVFESTHPYADGLDLMTPVKVPGATSFRIEFDNETKTENNCDYLEFYLDEGRSARVPNTEKYTGGKDGGVSNWPGMQGRPPLVLDGIDTFFIYFHSDGSVNDWGYKMYATPIGVKRKIKKVQVLRGNGLTSTMAEGHFSVLQAVLSDGLAPAPDKFFFTPGSIHEQSLAAPVLVHDRSVSVDETSTVQGKLVATTAASASSGNEKVTKSNVIPTTMVNKYVSLITSYGIAPSEVSVYELPSADSTVIRQLPKGTPVAIMDEQNEWIKLRDVVDNAVGAKSAREIGWVKRLVNEEFTLAPLSTPFTGVMMITDPLLTAPLSDSSSTSGKGGINPMYAVTDSTEEQASSKMMVTKPIIEQQILNQDFTTIEEALLDYSVIASNEYARQLASELLQTVPQQAGQEVFFAEDLSLSSLLTFLNINLAEASAADKSALLASAASTGSKTASTVSNTAAAITKTEASRRADLIFSTLLSLPRKFGIEADYALATGAMSYAIQQIAASFDQASGSGSMPVPVVRGYQLVIESAHPYDNNLDQDWHVSFPGAKKIQLTFSAQCTTETNCDYGKQASCYFLSYILYLIVCFSANLGHAQAEETIRTEDPRLQECIS